MPRFSKKSIAVLFTLHPDLQAVCNEAIKHFDFSLICGYRDKAGQDKAFASGNSKTPWPQSKHNKLPSHAFDFAPYPDSGKIEDYIFLAGKLMGIALQLKDEKYITSTLRYGDDWNRNDRTSDEKFVDAGHIEIDD